MQGFPPELRALLEDPGVVVVGVGINGDVLKLDREFGVSVRGVVDLARFAERRFVRFASHTLSLCISSRDAFNS